MPKESVQAIVKKFRFWILVSIFWTVLVQLSFYFIQKSQAKSLMGSIHGQLRQELAVSNFHFLARNLMDLEALGTIKCINFRLEGDFPKSILDTSYRGGCSAQSLLLNGASIQSELKALNGDVFNLSFISLNNATFIVALWFIRIVGLGLIASFYLYQKEKSEKDRALFELEQKHSKMLLEVAAQTSHDIRSPLSALSMVIGTLKEIPEEKRILIRNATQRINDIANDLLQKGQKNDQKTTQNAELTELASGNQSDSAKLNTEFIPALIDILVSEKRMQYREYSELDIETDLKDSFGAFAKINNNELKRVISNLINNAVEAFTNHQGRVKVGVKKISSGQAEQVEIFIKDNGKGIPKHILEKLGQMGVSHGKEGTQSGSGLGVYHAKKTAESFGGSFQIESTEGQGTLIKIILPLADSPAWFAGKIDLTGKKYLVSLDDDISIHQIWSGRLQSLGFRDIEHIKFQSGEAFSNYVNANINKLRQTQFLVDFELLNQSKTGLDIIEDLGIEKYSILVTSRHEEASIQSRAARLRLSILPKSLAGFVPIEMEAPKEHYDWVLLDDDELIHQTWAMAAKEAQKSFLCFRTPDELHSYKKKLNHEQIIYIDSSLGKGIKGEDIAKLLYAEGFRNLYLATGYSPEQFPKMEFIRGVIGKEPPNN